MKNLNVNKKIAALVLAGSVVLCGGAKKSNAEEFTWQSINYAGNYDFLEKHYDYKNGGDGTYIVGKSWRYLENEDSNSGYSVPIYKYVKTYGKYYPTKAMYNMSYENNEKVQVGTSVIYGDEVEEEIKVPANFVKETVETYGYSSNGYDMTVIDGTVVYKLPNGVMVPADFVDKTIEDNTENNRIAFISKH